MENMMILMYEDPDIVHAVISHVTDFYYELSKRVFEAARGAIDIFFIGNDLGSQTGPLIGEGLFREFICPYLKRLTDLGKEYGLPTMMHCCGSYTQLMPALIENGISAVQSLQPITREMQPGGGYILSPSHDYLLEETPVENVLAMYDTCLEEGGYANLADIQ